MYACIYSKKWRFGQVLPMPDTQTTEDRATQLLYSIQFKLSHAIHTKSVPPHVKTAYEELIYRLTT